MLFLYNPFKPETQITFSLPKDENIKLMVYDMLGQQVAVLKVALLKPVIIVCCGMPILKVRVCILSASQPEAILRR